MRPSFRAWAPWLVAFVAVVVATAFGTALARERGSRTELEAAAERFVTALLTYDSADLDSARSRVRPLVTDRFFANYEPTLKALAEVKAKTTGKAIQVFVGEPAGGRASAVVVTESTAETASGPRTIKGSHLRLDLVLEGGKWKVDTVVELAAGQSDGPPAPPQE